MQTRCIVTKASDDGTFQVGNHIQYDKDGAILCQEARGWIDAENVSETTKGMETIVDTEWIDAAVKRLLKFKDECAGLAQLKVKEMTMNFKEELVRAIHTPWNSRGKKMPPKDYDYPVLIQFHDGMLALSDGGTVHDDKTISLWKEVKQ